MLFRSSVGSIATYLLAYSSPSKAVSRQTLSSRLKVVRAAHDSRLGFVLVLQCCQIVFVLIGIKVLTNRYLTVFAVLINLTVLLFYLLSITGLTYIKKPSLCLLWATKQL